MRAATYGSYVNSIPANSVVNPSSFTSPAASATLNVSPVATVTKAFAGTLINQGDTSRVTLTLGNGAGVPLTNAFVSDTLPASIIVSTAPTVTNTCGGTVTANAGSHAQSRRRDHSNQWLLGTI